MKCYIFDGYLELEKPLLQIALFLCFFQTKLSTFDIGSNQITTIENVEHLKELSEFWVCGYFFFSYRFYLSTNNNCSHLDTVLIC